MAAVDERAGRELSDSEQRWLKVRSYLVKHRHELGEAAAAQYPVLPKAFGTALLTAPAWIPAQPLPLEAVTLELRAEASDRPPVDAGRLSIPTRSDGTRYPTYSSAVAELAAPEVFENRPTYRLLDADLAGPARRLSFGRGRYFDGLDVGEAAAHEYAARELGAEGSGLRQLIGDPRDLTRRPANLGISTLTVCLDEVGSASFLLHWRDPSKVGHAGGMYQVLPVGIFQPIDGSAASETNDFDLWRNIVREYSEELLGEPEPTGPVDYDAWPFATAMTAALRSRTVRAFVLGLGVDPLTFAADLLTAVVLPRPLFTELFGQLPMENAEGRLVTDGAEPLIPLTAESVHRFTQEAPMQAAGAAVLRAAWSNIEALVR